MLRPPGPGPPSRSPTSSWFPPPSYEFGRALDGFGQGWLVDGERASVRVQRRRHPQRQRGQVLAMAERQVIQHRDPERLQMLLQHILERLRPGPFGPLLAPVAFLHLA